MNSLVLLLFLIGIILITIGYTKSNNCPASKIKYKFIPRSLYEEQFYPNNISSNFKDMYDESSPWYNYYQGNLVSEDGNNNYDNFFKLRD